MANINGFLCKTTKTTDLIKKRGKKVEILFFIAIFAYYSF